MGIRLIGRENEILNNLYARKGAFVSKMGQLICLFGKWYNSETLKYETYCTNNTLELEDNNRKKKKKIMKKIEIEIPDGKRAEWVNGVLTLVDDTPKDVTERIKTFEDACAELGDEHPLVTQYRLITGAYKGEEETDDLIAYLKLRIIVAALNEGWKPKFTKDEWRWYPWHYLRTETESELAEKSDDWKADRHPIMIGDKYQSEYAGLAFAHSDYAPSSMYTYFGSRLCLKSEALATYCGKQFINLWADFVLIKK